MEKKISAEESVKDYYPSTSRPKTRSRAKTGTKPGLNID